MMTLNCRLYTDVEYGKVEPYDSFPAISHDALGIVHNAILNLAKSYKPHPQRAMQLFFGSRKRYCKSAMYVSTAPRERNRRARLHIAKRLGSIHEKKLGHANQDKSYAR